jgi:uncharacterized membrane-anchored protein YjiN (DUF445 family)
MADLDIPDSLVRDVVANSILERLKPYERDKLVSDAIASLLNVKRDWRQPGAFEQAVQSCVAEVAEAVVREKVTSDPEVRAKIAAAVGAAVDRVLEDTGWLRREVSKALSEAIRKANETETP